MLVALIAIVQQSKMVAVAAQQVAQILLSTEITWTNGAKSRKTNAKMFYVFKSFPMTQAALQKLGACKENANWFN